MPVDRSTLLGLCSVPKAAVITVYGVILKLVLFMYCFWKSMDTTGSNFPRSGFLMFFTSELEKYMAFSDPSQSSYLKSFFLKSMSRDLKMVPVVSDGITYYCSSIGFYSILSGIFVSTCFISSFELLRLLGLFIIHVLNY